MTDAPDAIFASGRRVLAGTADRRPARATAPSCTSRRPSPFKGGFIVHFAEIDDRNAAETWRDRYLLLPADELAPLGDDEVYVHDLLGMRVELASGEPVGTVDEHVRAAAGTRARRARATTAVDRDSLRPHRDERRPRARVIRIDPPDGLLDD